MWSSPLAATAARRNEVSHDLDGLQKSWWLGSAAIHLKLVLFGNTNFAETTREENRARCVGLHDPVGNARQFKTSLVERALAKGKKKHQLFIQLRHPG